MKGLLPFINKYFSPSETIINIQKEMEKKYNLDYDNICVLFLEEMIKQLK